MSPTGRLRINRFQGFTLMELLVVLLIVALFSALVSVRIEGVLSGGDLRLASRMIIGEVARLRGHAAHTRSEKALVFDVDENCYYQTTSGENETPLKKISFPKGVQLKDVTLVTRGTFQDGKAKIKFFANGCVERSLIHLINENDSEYTLEIRPITGRVIIHDRYIEQRSER
ncbi:prepilin-type N-terminal cleavage/methylation domain-containing protein [Thermodesulfobacteriota bacterium]